MSEENPFNLTPKLKKRFEQFKKIDDNTKRFQRIIELGKKLEPFEDALRTEDNRVKGCTSLTYIAGAADKSEDGELILRYNGDSNSHLVRGLLALLIEGFNNSKPEDVLKLNPAFIEDMGLSQTLTASRANGFMNTYSMMLEIAQKANTES